MIKVGMTATVSNRCFSYSTKEPGSSVIFIHEVRSNGVRASGFYHNCALSKILRKCSKISFNSDSRQNS